MQGQDHLGEHRRPRFKVGGANVNFIIYYEVDDDNSKHALSLAAFGEHKDWVLLEKA